MLIPVLYMGFHIVEQKQASQLNAALYQHVTEKTQLQIHEQLQQQHNVALILALNLAKQIGYFNQTNNAQNLTLPSDFHQFVAQMRQDPEVENFCFQILDLQGQSLYQSGQLSAHNTPLNAQELQFLTNGSAPLVTVDHHTTTPVLRFFVPIFSAFQSTQKQPIGFVEVGCHFKRVSHALLPKNSFIIVPKSILNEHFKSFELPFNPLSNGASRVDYATLKSWLKEVKKPVIWQDNLVIRYPLSALKNDLSGWMIVFIPLLEVEVLHTLEPGIQSQQTFYHLRNITFILVLFTGFAWVLYRQKQFYRGVINQEQEIVLITDGNKLIEANRVFFSYFKQPMSLKKFKKTYPSMGNFFAECGDQFAKNTPTDNWLEPLLNQPQAAHRVTLNFAGKSRVFSITANRIDSEKNLAVVVLNDITENEKLHRELLENALKDDLTGIGNRRQFNQHIKERVEEAKRYHFPLSLITFDIDLFKHVNDDFGHDVGDKVLKKVADIIGQQMRETDGFYRIGGEEFAVLLSHQSQAQALQVAQKMRLAIENGDFTPVPNLTISLGVAQFKKHTVQTLFKQADNALYKAKAEGRNQVQT